jgi:hypothetical protein
VTTPPAGWLATGLYWEHGQPTLTATGGSGGEHRRVAHHGLRLALQMGGPRRCIGTWDAVAGRRRPCPLSSAVAEGGPDAQCAACASLDRGRRIARDRADHDTRDFLLYLAWFGPGLTKVGITAAERGADRLLEQGALAHTWLARGPLAPIRRAEQAAAATGRARERLPTAAKTEAWWSIPGPAERAGHLAAAAHTLTPALTAAALALLPCEPADHVAAYGLKEPMPDRYRQVAAVGDGAAVAGTVVATIGRHLLLATAAEPVLIDTRLLAGWSLTAGTHPGLRGVRTTLRTRPHHARPDSLF